MSDDATHLRRFVEAGDEDAFRELVVRHFDLVHATALRQTNGDASLAEDVAQAVFTDLARKARLLAPGVVLAGWLYEATRFAAARAVRTELRRRAREQKALAMQAGTHGEPPDWEQIRPVLDAAMGKLNQRDRNAVLLHYFEGRNFRAVGAALGSSDDAAQKRVSRALNKLRAILTRGGVSITASSLSAFLSAAAAPAAPSGLALSVTKSSLAGAAALGPPGFITALAENFFRVKAAAMVAGVLLLGGGLWRLAYAGHAVDESKFAPVDLSGRYNGGLDRSWTPVYGNNDLAALGEGRHILKGVPFEVHGVIQLQGAEWKRMGYQFPEAVDGIPVGTAARRIHILHADSAFADPPSTPVASLVVHYADGTQYRLPIRAGLEALDWWDWPHAPVKRPGDPDTVVAWRGANPAAEHQGAGIRLFATDFANPRPDEPIQSIDYDSAMAGSAPFMVALTIEH